MAALQEASAFLLEYKTASSVRRFVQGCELRGKAKDILVTLSQALQIVLLQVSIQLRPCAPLVFC